MGREYEMTVRAQSAALSSCRWFTVSQLSLLHACELENMANLLSAWKSEMMLFSIVHQSIEYYPCYAFDKENGYMPAKELKLVLQEFGDSRSGWGLSFWFASVNGFLGGQRPQDLLKIMPDKVLAAAKDDMVGIQHG
jgi:hypothetical protein